MSSRLLALALAFAVTSVAPFALADIPNPTTSSSGAGGSGTGGSAGTGGDGSGNDSGGCAAAPGAAGTSAALVIGLGLICAVPLARRRSAKK